MIHYRKSGLLAIHGLIVFVCHFLLYVPFLFAERLGFAYAPVSDLEEAAFFVCFFLSGLGGFGLLRNVADRLPRLGVLDATALANRRAAILGLLFVLVTFLVGDHATRRSLLLYVTLASWPLYFLLDYTVPPLLGRTLFGGSYETPTLLVGSQRTALRLKDWIDRSASLGFRVEGLVTFDDTHDTPSIWGVPIIGEIGQLPAIIRAKRIGQVIILETHGSKRWLNYLADTSLDHGCRVLLYNNWEELFDRPLNIVHEGEHTFFSFQEEPLEDPLNRFAKRAFDIAVALPVCLFLLPPLWLFVAAVQRFQSRGPVLFRQPRCGRRGDIFVINKFRSMHVARDGPGTGDESRQAARDDDRVYPFGRFLRRTSIDEFPQFLNVLRGEMSVVGPRPHLPRHDEMFAAETKYYRARFFVKPGITGLAQVKGYRGEIVDPVLLHERVRWDLAYIHMWSVWLDVLIVARTTLHVLIPHRSAY